MKMTTFGNTFKSENDTKVETWKSNSVVDGAY